MGRAGPRARRARRSRRGAGGDAVRARGDAARRRARTARDRARRPARERRREATATLEELVRRLPDDSQLVVDLVERQTRLGHRAEAAAAFDRAMRPFRGKPERAAAARDAGRAFGRGSARAQDLAAAAQAGSRQRDRDHRPRRGTVPGWLEERRARHLGGASRSRSPARARTSAAGGGAAGARPRQRGDRRGQASASAGAEERRAPPPAGADLRAREEAQRGRHRVEHRARPRGPEAAGQRTTRGAAARGPGAAARPAGAAGARPHRCADPPAARGRACPSRRPEVALFLAEAQQRTGDPAGAIATLKECWRA